jgi:hypothetical protein
MIRISGHERKPMTGRSFSAAFPFQTSSRFGRGFGAGSTKSVVIQMTAWRSYFLRIG